MPASSLRGSDRTDEGGEGGGGVQNTRHSTREGGEGGRSNSSDDHLRVPAACQLDAQNVGEAWARGGRGVAASGKRQDTRLSSPKAWCIKRERSDEMIKKKHHTRNDENNHERLQGGKLKKRAIGGER